MGAVIGNDVRSIVFAEAQQVQSLAGPLQLRVVGIVQRLQVVVVALRHHVVLQQFLRAIQLEICAIRFNLRLLEVGARLSRVAALQCADLLSLTDFLARQNAEREHAPADQRVDMHHGGRVRHDACGQNQLARYLLLMDRDRLENVFLRRGRLRRGFIAMARRRAEQNERGGEEGRRMRRGSAVSWDDLRGCGEAELVNAEPDLLIGGQRIEIDLAVVAQSIEIIEQRGAAVAIAEFKVVAHASRLVGVVAVVAFGQIQRRVIRRPGLIHVVQHLVASGDLRESARTALRNRVRSFSPWLRSKMRRGMEIWNPTLL